MNQSPDDEIGRLLRAAVDDTEPGDRIAQIRERTRAPLPGPWRRRTTIGGVVLATAAAVGAVAVLPVLLNNRGPTSTTQPAADPTLGEPSDPQTVPAYFVGDTPRGPRLYREFVVVDGSDPRLLAALQALENPPRDPDYDTAWRQGSFVDATYSPAAGLITIDLAGSVELPDGYGGYDGQTTPGTDPLAVQQAVYTAQGAVGEGRVPVRFRVDGEPEDSVASAPVLDTLSLMSISYPFQGAEVKDSFTASGVANSFEANVTWRLEDESGAVMRDGFATAEGYLEPRLFPWETEVDITGLPAGAYTFVAETSDPSGGAEGSGADSDTRLVVIE